MALIRGQATHKKKAGMLTIEEDKSPALLTWKCADMNVTTNTVELSLDTVGFLKATPETSDKMMLKIGLETGKEILFGFNSRDVMDNVKVSIQQIIARKKTSINMEKSKVVNSEETGTEGTESPAPSSNGTVNEKSRENNSSTPSSVKEQPPLDNDLKNDRFLAELLNSKQLIKNLALQQRLLRDNVKLMRTFTEAVIKEGMEAEEFWKSRIHLLRSFAIQNNQKKGPYNVLSTIKPVASSDNEVNVNVTREKIKEIFKQYPIVRKAYDDNVPRMSEGEFWSRFFSSKLFRKLRGEKVNIYDRGDITLDKYLYIDPDYDGEEEIDDEQVINDDPNNNDNSHIVNNYDKKRRKIVSAEKMAKKKKVKLFSSNGAPIPKYLDIEGNRSDDSQLKGNTPDITMKDNQDPELVGILRTMNRLSRRLMAEITDEQPTNTDDLDDEIIKELELNDLDESNQVEYNELKYTQSSNVSLNIIPQELINKVINQSNLNPELCEYDLSLQDLKDTFKEKYDLTRVYKNMKEEGKKQNDSYKDINNIVKQNAKLAQNNNNLNDLLGLPSTGNTIKGNNNKRNKEDEDSGIKINLDNKKLDSVKLTHATSIEFLRQFWTQFNITASSTPATDPNFKSDLIKLRKHYFSIKKCLVRVEAQIEDCRNSKEKETEKELFEPLVFSLNTALKKYEDSIVKSKSSS